MMKWLGRFLIFWPFAVMLSVVGYGIYLMPFEDKMGIVLIFSAFASIVAGLAIIHNA